jgi:hypothetical protein
MAMFNLGMKSGTSGVDELMKSFAILHDKVNLTADEFIKYRKSLADAQQKPAVDRAIAAAVRVSMAAEYGMGGEKLLALYKETMDPSRSPSGVVIELGQMMARSYLDASNIFETQSQTILETMANLGDMKLGEHALALLRPTLPDVSEEQRKAADAETENAYIAAQLIKQIAAGVATTPLGPVGALNEDTITKIVTAATDIATGAMEGIDKDGIIAGVIDTLKSGFGMISNPASAALDTLAEAGNAAADALFRVAGEDPQEKAAIDITSKLIAADRTPTDSVDDIVAWSDLTYFLKQNPEKLDSVLNELRTQGITSPESYLQIYGESIKILQDEIARKVAEKVKVDNEAKKAEVEEKQKSQAYINSVRDDIKALVNNTSSTVSGINKLNTPNQYPSVLFSEDSLMSDQLIIT